MNKNKKYYILLLFIIILIILIFLTIEQSNKNISKILSIKLEKYKYDNNPNIQSIKKLNNIYVVWHICTIKNWKYIVEEQLNTIIYSGLYDNAKYIYYGCVGKNCLDKLKNIFYKYSKLKLIKNAVNEDPKKYEILTINSIKSLNIPDNSYLLYIHSKGVTNRNIYHHYWRKYLMSSMVDNYRICIDLLIKGFLTIGPNVVLYNDIFKKILEKIKFTKLYSMDNHYSGNFFWINTNHLKNLENIKIKDENKINRSLAELWVLKNYEKNKNISIGNSYINIPLKLYKTGQNIFKVNNEDIQNMYIF